MSTPEDSTEPVEGVVVQDPGAQQAPGQGADLPEGPPEDPDAPPPNG